MAASARASITSPAREHQMTLFERLEGIARRAGQPDPLRPALGLFFVVLSLLALGFLMQASHASTTVRPEDFRGELVSLGAYRVLALAFLVLGFRLGPLGVRRFVPFLSVVAVLLLASVYVPFIGAATNGSRRWIHLGVGGLTLQPSEVARVVMVLWVARRCVQLGPRVTDMARGYLPMVVFGLVLFASILGQPDLGGALLFLVCFVCTMWVGGARPAHVAGSLGMVGGGALFLGVTYYAYIRERLAMWLGETTNEQLVRSAQAMSSGDLFGVGLTHGGWRNSGLQYMQNDFAFALVGEELGLVGSLVVIGLWGAFAWFALQLVLSVRDRFSALVAFGLLASVAFQAMLHLQVVTGLAPPKGMNLPFLSDGGTSLVASSFAVGLALGSVRRLPRDVQGL